MQALKLGTANVQLRDRNMKDPTTGHTPFITVHVVNPHRLSLALLPERSWATTLKRDHAIQVELFDEHGNYIQPNDRLFVQVDVPEAFQVTHSSTNGTHHQGTTIKTGVYKVNHVWNFTIEWFLGDKTKIVYFFWGGSIPTYF